MSTTLPSMAQSMAHSLKPLPLRTTTNHQNPLLHVERQAKHIQRNLQCLIDAQSEGLLAGLGGQPNGSVISESHVSSELASPRSASAVPMPVRQPPRKKVGLRSAREGIYVLMHDLMRLRQEELAILSSRQEDMESGLNDIDTFNAKRASLENAIATIHDEGESRLSRDLEEKSSRLEEQIHEMENKLAQMKAQHRHVVQELSQLENSVDSKLSSYKASLSLLESDVRKFLTNPPVEQARNGAQKDFYSLKPSRRSLEMAQEHWTKERSDLEHRQDEVYAEIEALEQGGDMWKQVVKDISGFEKRLKATMARSMQTQEQLLQDGLNKDSLVPTMMEDLEQTTQLVERQLNQAEGKNWKLLVCCISAELQALREARELLLDAFNLTGEDLNLAAPEHHDEESGHIDHGSDSPTDPLGFDNPEPPADLLQDIDRRDHEHEMAKSEDEEDDEPDPAWLLPET